MEKINIDAENAVMGRMGSYVAKQLLKGNEVIVNNAEKVLLTGSLENNLARIKTLRKKGGSSQKGPLVSKVPERLLKRMIRGMLPWDRTRGREAWKRLKCYNGVQEPNGKRFDEKLPIKFVTLKQITDLL